MAYPWVPLAEVCEPVARTVAVEPGTAYRTIGVKWWGEGAYERETIDGSQTRAKALYLVKEGDLIINKIWVRHGSTAIAGDDVDGCSASGEFPMFRLDESRALPRWVHWHVKTRSFWQRCAKLSRGTSGKNRIRPELFLTIEIPLPPLAEQRRIVARIDDLAAKIDEARRLRQAAIAEAVALLPAQANALYSVGRDSLPTGWQWASVAGLGQEGTDTVQTGPFGAQLHKSEFVTEGRPVLAIGNVQWGCLDTALIDHVTEEKASELARYVLRSGDVLFTRSGTVGRSAVVPDYADGWLMTGHILRIRIDQTRCLPTYLFYAFRGSRAVQDQVEGSTRGATRGGFNTSLLASVELPLPPIPEQRRIVAHLDGLQAKVDDLRKTQADTAAELDALLPSILDKAFKGEL